MIDVRTFFPVELDGDEMLFQKLADRLVFKRFPLHHMAPVAGAIANAQQDWFALRFGAGKGFLSPRIPVYRIVLVLEQVGAFFRGKAIGMGRCVHSRDRGIFGHCGSRQHDQHGQARQR